AGIAVRRLALAIINAATATSDVRAVIERVATGGALDDGEGLPASESIAAEEVTVPEPSEGLLPTTRQAIQVSIAAALAIVVGELVSPARWYWAVIATFVILAGTHSWGETLTKGWQRLVGTVLGVPCGVLVAIVFEGNRVGSLVMIFVCLFCA